MLNFNKQDNQFSVTVRGDGEVWLGTVRSLCHLLASQNENMIDSNDVYNVAMLISEMLPDARQAEMMVDKNCEL